MGVRLSGKSFPATELASGCVAKGPLVFEDGGSKSAPAIQFEGPEIGIHGDSFALSLVHGGEWIVDVMDTGLWVRQGNLGLLVVEDPSEVSASLSVFLEAPVTVEATDIGPDFRLVANGHATEDVTINNESGGLLATVSPLSVVVLVRTGLFADDWAVLS